MKRSLEHTLPVLRALMPAVTVALAAALTTPAALAQAGLAWKGCPELSDSDFHATTITTNARLALSMDVDTGGRVFIAQKVGGVYMYLPKEGKTVKIADVPVHATGNIGLWGIALHPGFPAKPWIYLYYTPQDGSSAEPYPDTLPDFRLSRFTFDGQRLDLASEKILLRVPNSAVGVSPDGTHTGGKLRFGPDGTLFLTTGDNRNYKVYPTTSEQSRTLTALHTSGNSNDFRGKVLRIRPNENGTYSIPEGNLFPPGLSGALPEIYAMGMRNPVGLKVDAPTGWVLISEAGPGFHDGAGGKYDLGGDELHLFRGPGNGGWPMFYGKNEAYQTLHWPQAPIGKHFDPRYPVNLSQFNSGLDTLPPADTAAFVIDHTPGFEPSPLGFDNSGNRMVTITGPLYRYDPALDSKVKLPPHFHGQWLMGSHTQGMLGALAVDARGDVAFETPIFRSINFPSGPIDMDLSPQGALYVLSYYNGQMVRIEYRGTCLPDQREFTTSPVCPGGDCRPSVRKPVKWRIHPADGGLVLTLGPSGGGNAGWSLWDSRGRRIPVSPASGDGRLSARIPRAGIYFLEFRRAGEVFRQAIPAY